MCGFTMTVPAVWLAASRRCDIIVQSSVQTDDLFITGFLRRWITRIYFLYPMLKEKA